MVGDIYQLLKNIVFSCPETKQCYFNSVIKTSVGNITVMFGLFQTPVRVD